MRAPRTTKKSGTKKPCPTPVTWRDSRFGPPVGGDDEADREPGDQDARPGLACEPGEAEQHEQRQPQVERPARGASRAGGAADPARRADAPAIAEVEDDRAGRDRARRRAARGRRAPGRAPAAPRRSPRRRRPRPARRRRAPRAARAAAPPGGSGRAPPPSRSRGRRRRRRRGGRPATCGRRDPGDRGEHARDRRRRPCRGRGAYRAPAFAAARASRPRTSASRNRSRP